MRFRVAAGLVFALLMFLIPLLALVGNVDMVQYSPAEDASAPQAAAPAGTGRDAPETDSPAPAAPAGTTPAVAVADDGFRVLDERTGKVFEVSARDYVRGALAAEMPPTFHPEALKAQAVAAHTYALRLKEQNRAAPDETLKGADFSADPQGWKSYTTEALFRERYGELADAYWKAVCGAAAASPTSCRSRASGTPSRPTTRRPNGSRCRRWPKSCKTPGRASRSGRIRPDGSG